MNELRFHYFCTYNAFHNLFKSIKAILQETNTMRTIDIIILCTIFISSANKEKQEYFPQFSLNNTVTFRVTDNNSAVGESFSDAKASGIHWAHLLDPNEGVVKVSFNTNNNEMCREKANDIVINGNSIFRGKSYISIVSLENNLIYKGEADFYLEDRHGRLEKVPNSGDKESIALYFKKGNKAEIEVVFPKGCQPGDYCLRIKVYNEQEEYYEIYQWYEAYTSKQISKREKPILVGPALLPNYKTPAIEDGVFEVVESMPEFPGGGMPQLMKFIKNNLQYEKSKDGEDIRKSVIVQIIIDKDGAVTHPKVIRGASPILDREALRIMELMPKWKPGSQHGIPVKVKFTFPVYFESPAD